MYRVNDSKLLISASVSCMDMLHFEACMQEVEAAGIDFYHYDVVDGRFNDCFILGQTLLQSMRPRTSLPIEVHLAVYEPERFIKQYAGMGADYIGIHAESTDRPLEALQMIADTGAAPVLTLRAETAFTPDMAQLARNAAWINKLTVNPGYSGQALQPQAVRNLEEMRKTLDSLGIPVRIQADGNIYADTIPTVVAAGASILAGGTSGLFNKSGTVKENLQKMRDAAAGAMKG